MVPEAFERTDMGDDALRYLRSLMFRALHFLVENSQLYTFRDEELGDCVEVTKCRLERNASCNILADAFKYDLNLRRKMSTLPRVMKLTKTWRL